jgi:hypothetical protein
MKMKKTLVKNTKRAFVLFVGAMAMLSMASAGAVCATDASSATAPLDRLTDILFSVVASIGIIALIFGIVQLALAFKGHDPQQKMQAVLSIVGGILLISIKAIVIIIKG